jgi:thiamine-monophosphate kinase
VVFSKTPATLQQTVELGSVQRRTVDLPRKREVLEDIRPSAVIDVSDGLGLDLTRLCEASRLGCRLNERDVPVSRAARRLARDDGRREIDAALGGGEDFELLFTWPAEDLGLLQRAAQERSISITAIGAMVPRDEGCVLVREDATEEALPALGGDHFRSAPGRGA